MAGTKAEMLFEAALKNPAYYFESAKGMEYNASRGWLTNHFHLLAQLYRLAAIKGNPHRQKECYDAVKKISKKIDTLPSEEASIIYNVLGNFFYRGWGVIRNQEKALEQCLKAHQHSPHNPIYMRSIARCYQSTSLNNPEAAKKWYVLAAVHDDEKSIKQLKTLCPERTVLDLAQEILHQASGDYSEHLFMNNLLNFLPFEQKKYLKQKLEVRERLRNSGNLDTPLSNGKLPLHAMIELGEIELVKELLEAGANSCAKDCKGRTALHVAVGHHQRKVLEILLEKPVATLINEPEPIYGLTPLLIATRSRDIFAMNLLLEKKADPTIASQKTAWTPLHYAAHNGDEIACIYLLRSNVNVNTPSKKGNTPLHLAVREQHNPLVTLLLYHGANVTIENKRGRTPMSIPSRSTDILTQMYSDNYEAIAKIEEEMSKPLQEGIDPILHEKKIIALKVLKGIIKQNPYRPLSVNLHQFKITAPHYENLNMRSTKYSFFSEITEQFRSDKAISAKELVDSFDSSECGKYFPDGQLPNNFDVVIPTPTPTSPASSSSPVNNTASHEEEHAQSESSAVSSSMFTPSSG